MCADNVGTREEGAVLVEMAFAIPILALILICIIDLGLIVREYQLIQNAAREGARYSSVQTNRIYDNRTPCATLDSIKQFVVAYAAEENIAINAADVTVSQVSADSTVTVTYARPLLFRGSPFLPLGSITLRASSVFHNLYGGFETTLPPGTTCP